MKPIDFRNATFADLRAHLAGMREEVFNAWCKHGPGTTHEVCDRASLSILSFRPRTTELVQLGFLRLADAQPAKGEGVYTVCTAEEQARWLADEKRRATTPQQEFKL